MKAKADRKNRKQKEKLSTRLVRTVLLILPVYILAALGIFTAAVLGEVDAASEDMETAVSTVAESYRENSGTESRLEESYLETYQSEVLVVNHILSDYDIQKYGEEERREAAGTMEEIGWRSSGKALYVCDEQGSLYLASGEDRIGDNLVEKGIFTEEQFGMLLAEADRPEILSGGEKPEPLLLPFDGGSGYCFCTRLTDSRDMPTDYCLVMVYDADLVNEGIDAWLDKTVLAEAVSGKNPLMEFFILEEEDMIYSTTEGKTWTDVTFTGETEAGGKEQEWGELSLTDDEGNTVNYSFALQETVERENGQSYRILAALDYLDLTSDSQYRFGGAAGSSTVLLALLLLFVIYCFYAGRTLRNRREFLLISGGICVVALLLFGIMASYFQSLEDLTEVTITADRVTEQIRELKENQEERSDSLAMDHMRYDLVKLGLVAFDVEYSGKKISNADAGIVYHQMDEDGYTVPRKDSYGNDLVCYAGSELLKDKASLFDGADLWIVNDTGYAVASSNPDNWSFNINEKEYADDAWKVLYGETGNLSIYYEKEDLEKGEDYVGSVLIYPVNLFTYPDASGQTVYLDRKGYEKALKAGTGWPLELPEVQMGLLLVRTYQQPEALCMSEESFENSLSTIVTAAGCSYALMDYDSEEGCLDVTEQIREAGAELDLDQLSVPDGIRESTVFNYFQEISKQDCFVRVTKDASEGEAEAIVFRESVVHSRKDGLLGAYLLAAGFAFLLSFLILISGAGKGLREKKKQAEAGPPAECTAGAKSFRSKLATFVNERREEAGDRKTAQIVQLLLYLVILLAVFSVVRDLFLTKDYGGTGVFVNIYSTDWERCINAYNIGAVIVLIIVAWIATGFVKLLTGLFCVPLGRKVETYAKLVVSVIQYAFVFLGIFYGAYLLGMELKSIGTFATVIAGVIGIGSQQLISDVGSGVAMLGEGRYMIGDLVQVDGFTGVIREMGIRNCILVNEELIEKSVSNGRMSNAALLKKNVPIPGMAAVKGKKHVEEKQESEVKEKEENEKV